MDYYLTHFANTLTGRSDWLDRIIVFVGHDLGYGLIILFIGVVWISQSHWRDRIIIWTQGLIAVVIARGILVILIRSFVHRLRPFVIYSDIRRIIPQDPAEYSFPSGHAAIFFTLSLILLYYHRRWGAILLFLTTLMVASRVIGGVHYPSDILVGFFIAMISTALTLRLTKNFTQVSRR